MQIALIAVVLLLMLALAGWIFWSLFSDLFGKRDPQLPAVTETLSGTDIVSWRPSLEELRAPGVVWATSAPAFSTQLAQKPSDPYSAAQIVGPPDVYPHYGNKGAAWSSSTLNVRQGIKGEDFVVVAFPKTRATALLIVETLHQGAVIRVDDLSDPDHPTALWEGKSPAAETQARVLKLTLDAPREITALRVNVYSRQIMARPQLDAVGLIEAPR